MIADVINTQINLGILVEMSGSHDISDSEVLGFVNEVAHGALIAIVEVIAKVRYKVKAQVPSIDVFRLIGNAEGYLMLSSVLQTSSRSFVFSIQEGITGIQINILAQSVRTVQLYALQSCLRKILVRHNHVAFNAGIQIRIIIGQLTGPIGAD